MPGSPDIKRAIEIIEQRIQSLQQVKEMLVTEFFGEEQPASPDPVPETTPWLFNQPKRKITLPPVQKTRKQTLIDFLKQHGPSVRGQIMEQTKMPRGTLAFLLNDKETFSRLDDGRWMIRQK
jgi:hypothetical protein